MKPINVGDLLDKSKINENASLNTLTAAIKETEGRARERRITATDILNELHEIQIGLGISKKAMNDVKVTVDLNKCHISKSYWLHSYKKPSTTQFCAIYKNGTWRVTGIWRGEMDGRRWVYLPDAAKEAILRRHELGEF